LSLFSVIYFTLLSTFVDTVLESLCWLTMRQRVTYKIDIDTSSSPVTARTTRSLSITAVKLHTEAGRSSNSNSFCQPCFLCRCTCHLELTAGQCCQLGHLRNF